MLAKKRILRRRRNCIFCQEKKEPDYKETAVLHRFISDRCKIISSFKTGICAKHQSRLARAIKEARHLAFLPFVTKSR